MKLVLKTVSFVTIGLAVIGITAFSIGLRLPAKAKLITTYKPQAIAPPGLLRIDTTYASFSYPSDMTPKIRQATPNTSYLAEYTFTKQDLETWNLVITINKLAAPRLSSDSGFALRQSQPKIYTQSTATKGHAAFTIMTDDSAADFSKVAFTLHGDMSGDIALQGLDEADQASLAQTFNEVLSSWQWRR